LIAFRSIPSNGSAFSRGTLACLARRRQFLVGELDGERRNLSKMMLQTVLEPKSARNRKRLPRILISCTDSCRFQPSPKDRCPLLAAAIHHLQPIVTFEKMPLPLRTPKPKRTAPFGCEDRRGAAGSLLRCCPSYSEASLPNTAME